MVTTNQIEEIANEVIRRLELLLGNKRALLLLSGQETREHLKCVEDTLQKHEYIFTQCLLGQKGSSEPLPFKIHGTVSFSINFPCADLEKTIGMHHALVVAGLHISQLVALRNLEVKGNTLLIIYEALRQGKEVYLFSGDLELSAASKQLSTEVYKVTTQLEEWNINFPQIAKGKGTNIDKKLVAMQDICDLETGPLIIGQKTMLAPLAHDYLRDRKIEIIRK